MNVKSSSKKLLGSPRPPKKKLISKGKKLTIDLPAEDETPTQNEFPKNSPKHRHIKTVTKSVTRVKTPASEITKKIYSPTPKGKIFLFPPETVKTKSKFSSKALSPKPLRNSTNTKPKTPSQQKKSKKLIMRPKTTNPLKTLKPGAGSFPNINVVVTQVPAAVSRNKEEIYNEHLFQTFQALKIVNSLPPVDLDQLREKMAKVPRRAGYEGKKTLVFDLDETLVHCCENPEEMRPDVFLPVTFPNGEVINAGINIRPFAQECLKEVNKYFEVFVFTASHQCYANVVLDYLDPTGELIHQRFFRDNCINMNGIYIKDLRIFADRNLSDVVIVDNAAYSFAYQVDNGIPIISWHDDRDDREMLNLIDYLKSLVEVEDIREVNFETFHLRTFYEDYMNEFIINNNEMSSGYK
jgi:Dullard-like phosphatase family protein